MVNLSILILIDRLVLYLNMKGLLHTLAYQLGDSTTPVANNAKYLLDTSADLTRKLQKMVRQGQIFKVVGFDISLENNLGGSDDVLGSCSGSINYISPTKARCDAWRHAFKATQKWRKIQGISPNYNYDFRVGLEEGITYANTKFGSATYNDIANQAWLETNGTGNALGLNLLSTTTDSQQSLFDVWNLGIEMSDATAVPTFGAGWNPYLPDSGLNTTDMDFVINEASLLVTNPNGPQYASLEKSKIPFSCAYGQSATAKGATNFEWRPVTGEYIPVMNGLFEVHCKDVSQTSETDTVELLLNVHIAGWYPILKRRKSRRKFRGRRRRK